MIGSVRRRFFTRHGGGLGSNVEVEASVVGRATARTREAAWQRADTSLEALLDR